MTEEPASLSRIAETANAVNQMIDEGRLAKALSLLYFMHKLTIKEWVLVKRELIASASTPKRLQSIALILEASKKATLAESSTLVPGLVNRPST